MAAMNLDLCQMDGSTEQVRRTCSEATLGQRSDQYDLVDTGILDLMVRRDKTRYRVAGRLEAMLEIECCRCLEPFRLGVGVDIDLMYVPASANTGEGDLQIEEADLSSAYYRDEQIDLGQLVREQFQLALPMKPLCCDDCQGLCTVCGGNQNTTMCQCVETWEDPRLAALKRLLIK
jgi:uncharacterized metal-binding protein YceD (DUF177 family)